MAGPREELGPYRIVRKIAVGGMAEIYLARQRGIEGLERTVVLKQILEKHEQNEEFVTMFLDEARLMAALSHPNIAQVFDLGKVDDTHYLVMEYVRGPTLHQILGAAQRASLPGLPEKPALGIALRVAEALHYVHERRDDLGRPLGIVHRDLNPANVVVSYDGSVKLIDFGIAKAATKVYETRTGVIKGTYGYIAPEALTGTAPVDRRADVFALGILLYEMLVGKHPFDVSDEPNLLDRILEARYKRPRDVRPSIPGALDRLIARCLAPHPEGRPESVQKLIDELAAHMSERGIVPTQVDLAALARELVPDEEGPLPLRRPTSVKPRPVFPRGEARDGGTRKVSSSVPPPEDEPTRRAMPMLRGEVTPPRALDGTRKVGLPRSSSVPPEPTPHPRIDESISHDAATRPPRRGPSPATISSELDEPTVPAGKRPPIEPEEPTVAVPPREPVLALPPPPFDRAVETTMRLRPAARTIPPLLGAFGLIAAGTLAFLAARVLAGGTPPPEASAVVPPVGPEATPTELTTDDAGSSSARALHVISEPPGAHVVVDGVDVQARTPAVLSADPRLPAVFLHVSLEGYAPQTRQVSTTIGEARFVLTPLAYDAGTTEVDAGTTTTTATRAPAAPMRRGGRRGQLR
ncbi:serine/threonine-protein kinase [Sandaracinus amylolyticus]|uniref:Serine/threonine protein kinase n=1 Tax=Sandaracinus amylolyticus TaxID=927083 RepID=A0A0F6YIM5_9BACT|nr:serine/threonine-protein kinase [Sandaracinus amylolyticus]AKF07220.1 serine/threonine protein kinase [Sandaracinus amylolyticus]